MYDKFYDVVLPQNELWVPVKGYEGLYEVSNYGQVRSLDRYRTWFSEYHKGEVTRLFKGKILTNKLKDTGYEEVHLRDEDRHNYWTVHKIVSEGFHKDIKLPLIDHKNDIKNCNLLWNLHRCTAQYNTKKAVNQGKVISGNTGYTRKISEEKKELVREKLKEGWSIRRIERECEISQRSVARIRDGLL
ncbi:HNH endonuclease [Vibrio phage F99]